MGREQAGTFLRDALKLGQGQIDNRLWNVGRIGGSRQNGDLTAIVHVHHVHSATNTVTAHTMKPINMFLHFEPSFHQVAPAFHVHLCTT
jgi:hypothetical protein